MSNIEPTEEQRQAANAFVLKTRIAEEDSFASRGLARLLAEREAKLREEVTRLETLCTEEARLIVERDTLRARVAELEAKIADGVFSCPGCGRHDFGFFASQIKAACGPCRTRAENAEARVTELEAACGERLAKLGEAYEEAETGWLGDIKELEEREAQHLADINALHQFLGDHEEEEGIWIPRSEFKDVPCRKYLAHYDDAKADAPAVDWQAWANGTCPEPGCSLANPHEQGVACVKPTAEGGEG